MAHDGFMPDQGRGWLYAIVNRRSRTVYFGSTGGFVPARALKHVIIFSGENSPYMVSQEVLRGYAGFGQDKRHVLIDLMEVVGDRDLVEFKEGKLIASGFWMCLAGRKYKCWENDASQGCRARGVASFRLKKRRVVLHDTVFKNQNLKTPGGIPRRLSMRRELGLRRGGICWVCGHLRIGGCNAPLGEIRTRHSAMVKEHRVSG